MSQKTDEEILITVIKEAIPKIKNKKNEFTAKYKNQIGFLLGYFLTGILKSAKDSKFRGKWIDFIQWKSLVLTESNQIKGEGSLWWGPRNNYSVTYSEKFYAELNINDIENIFDSYSFRFQIDGKKYEFKK